MNKKKNKEERNWETLGIFLGIMMIAIGVIIGMNIRQYPSIQDVCHTCNDVYGDGNDYTVNEIDVLIDKIAEDCGSTHITKQYNDNEWSVFKRVSNGDWEKTEYKHLSDCLEDY